MAVNQIAVFLENKTGEINKLSACLARNGINMLAFVIADTVEFGVLRIIADNPDRALDCLLKEGYNASLTKVLAVSVLDKPGAISQVLDILSEASIDIAYLYSYVRFDGKAVILLKVSDFDSAVSTLKKNNIIILDSLN